MTVRSAGILLYRRTAGTDGTTGAPTGGTPVEVWIAHMGGPFWSRKDDRAWSIPKGEYDDGEDPLAAAHREFAEEMGTPAPPADYFLLGSFRQPSGKVITVFSAEADFAPSQIVSNTFPLEWPRGSGTVRHFPEVDDARWVEESVARIKLVKGQLPVLDALMEHLAGSGG
ncbi:NUDIX domain-containing protein [Arthrobacter sp. EPSL27]|uniref:NUDIX domain-containing protein n=1 Tax=Arthrobacter sp. EPSL27 TaxID=1745378 RepID=UPI0007466868|nr:NUDIX domain-containing protein [Arthrobacter sp. EPSL27]KUM33211.1 DNA mismatch repair protein MutT [Arthrobacter sp. EPSL27]